MERPVACGVLGAVSPPVEICHAGVQDVLALSPSVREPGKACPQLWITCVIPP